MDTRLRMNSTASSQSIKHTIILILIYKNHITVTGITLDFYSPCILFIQLYKAKGFLSCSSPFLFHFFGKLKTLYSQDQEKYIYIHEG